jgi:hypothetical protein
MHCSHCCSRHDYITSSPHRVVHPSLPPPARPATTVEPDADALWGFDEQKAEQEIHARRQCKKDKSEANKRRRTAELTDPAPTVIVPAGVTPSIQNLRNIKHAAATAAARRQEAERRRQQAKDHKQQQAADAAAKAAAEEARAAAQQKTDTRPTASRSKPQASKRGAVTQPKMKKPRANAARDKKNAMHRARAIAAGETGYHAERIPGQKTRPWISLIEESGRGEHVGATTDGEGGGDYDSDFDYELP